MSDVLIILAEGFEEAEAVITIDVLRRLEFEVCIASLSENKEVLSSRKIKFVADAALNEIKNRDYRAVVLPGGMPGSSNLRNSDTVIEIVKKTNDKGALVCAICAAPIVLSHAGILDNIKFTAYPGFEHYFNTTPLTDMVVQEGNIITGKGPGAAFEFAMKISRALGKDPSVVAKGMLVS